jgi:4a-hydroxytetrahydrobiopterin dehydratase
MSEALANRSCVPCRGGTPPLTREQIAPLLEQVEGWTVEDDKKLVKSYRFPDFARALAFVNRVGEIAEAEGHHPDLHLSWGRVGAEIWTHKIGGLTESDFILAAKLDRARAEMGL